MGSRDVAGASCTTACRFMAANSSAAPATWLKGFPSGSPDETLGKFRADGLLLVHAGGGAGLFSAMIGGWANGSTGSQPVTRKVVR